MAPTVIFRRIRGRIIPIVKSGLDKAGQAFHGERIAAIRAVKATITGKHQGRFAHGVDALVHDTGDTVVKTINEIPVFRSKGDVTKLNKQFKRRVFLESVLHDAGIGAKTLLVETRKSKYLVQEKAERTLAKSSDDVFKKFYDGGGRTAMAGIMKNLKMTNMDSTSQYNVGIFEGIPKIIDAGEEWLERAMTPKEIKSARDKIISYGKRSRK